jgi:hypothetical protein
MGRVTTYTDKVASQICARISEGEPLRAICREKGMPAWRTVYDWVNSRPEFAARIAHARELGFDAIAEDTIEMIDEKPERTETQYGDKVDAGHVQWQKNRVEQRLKLLSKWSPQKYGDRQAIDLSGHLALGDMTDEEIKAELAALTGVTLPADSADAD